MQAPQSPKRLLSWRFLNEIAEALRSYLIIPGKGIKVDRTLAGQRVSVKLPQVADFKITVAGFPAGGIEQRPVAGGTWADLTDGRVVTAAVDGLYERNGNATVPVGTVVFATRNPGSNLWVYDRSACSVVASAPPKPAPKPTPSPSPALSPEPAPTGLSRLDSAPLPTGPKWPALGGGGPTLGISGLVPPTIVAPGRPKPSTDLPPGGD